MDVTLKLATEVERPLVAALMNAAFRGEMVGRSWTTEAGFITGERTSEVRLREEMGWGRHLLVMTDGEAEAVRGCVTLRELGGERWYLGGLAVEPELQSAGVGRRILLAAEEYAAERGACVMEITVVNVRETLIAWYERRGYVRTGEVRAFPYGDNRFGTPMRDDLEFVVLEKRLRD